MSRINMSARVGQIENLRKDMKKAMISNETTEYCIANAKGATLSFLCDMFSREARKREASRISNIVQHANFPTPKNIDDYDFSNVKMPAQLSVEDLKSLKFIKEGHNLIMYGICGTGKTMLSICLGMQACQQGYRVKFYTLAQLATRLNTVADEGRLDYFLNQLSKLDLLILDEWGYTQVDSKCAGLIYRVIADRYENKSLIVTTNLPFSEWGRIVVDEQLAAAIIDRIVHHGYFIDTGKKDWRLINSPMNHKIT